MNTLYPENQAFEYFRQGNYTESIALYEQCIENKPEKTEYYYYLGLNYFLLGEEEEAQATWMSLLMTDNPEEIELAIRNLVNFLEQETLRQLEKNNIIIATKIHNQIFEIEPTYSNYSLDFKAKIPFLYGEIPALAKARQFSEVIEVLKLILQLDDTFASGWHDLAVTYYQIQEYNLALDAINKARQLSPANALAHYNTGLILEKLDNKNQAIESYKTAIKLDKNLVDAYNNLGNIFFERENWDEAKSIYRECLQYHPNHFGTALNLFRTLRSLEDTQTLNDFVRERAKLFPKQLLWQLINKLTLPVIYNNEKEIGIYRQKFSQGLEEISQDLDLSTEVQKSQSVIAIALHCNFYLPYQNFNVVELQQKYGFLVSKVVQANHPQWCKQKQIYPLKPGEKIRLGFISTNLVTHAANICILGWIKNINRQFFEIYCYHIGKKIDATTEFFRQASDFFHHIYNDYNAVAEQVNKDNLHIIIYGDIGMDGQLILLSSMNLAPIQCTTWGHPVTSGISTIDYFLSSELMEPENAQAHYSEQLILLPNLASNYATPQLPKEIKSRKAFGIPEDKIIYVSCQSVYKYLPQHDYIFPSIAQRIKEAQFTFLTPQQSNLAEQFQKRLKTAFAEFGLNSEDFCLFLPRVGRDDYLNRNLVSDIYLDTFGWSGGNTTLEAIACNLPVVTCPGEFMRGRHSYGILRMLGIEDTIAYSEQEYIDIAVRLGNDLEWRSSIVEKIKANQDRVFEDKTCVRALDEFFKQLVKVNS